MRVIHLRQQLDVARRETAREPVPPMPNFLHLAVLDVARHQPRDLCPAAPRHRLHIAPQQPATYFALLPVALITE